MKRFVTLMLLFVGGVVLADNCGSFSDCFPGFRAALAGLAAFGISAAALSNYLGSLPGIGTAKGVVEGVTGRSVIDGSPIGWKERAEGLIPVVGAAGKLGKEGGIARDIGEAAEGYGTAKDVKDAAEGVPGILDVIKEGYDAYKSLDPEPAKEAARQRRLRNEQTVRDEILLELLNEDFNQPQ